MDPTRLADALHGVRAGEAALSRTLVVRVIEEFRNRQRRRLLRLSRDRAVELTEREWEVLQELRDGLTTQEIADALGIAPVPVRRHISSTLAKLRVSAAPRPCACSTPSTDPNGRAARNPAHRRPKRFGDDTAARLWREQVAPPPEPQHEATAHPSTEDQQLAVRAGRSLTLCQHERWSCGSAWARTRRRPTGRHAACRRRRAARRRWSGTERRHHTLAAVWQQARPAADEQAPWDRYAAWAKAEDDQVQLMLIKRARHAGHAAAPSPFSAEVRQRLEAEEAVQATLAMEGLRSEAAQREDRARDQHEQAAAAAARKPYEDALTHVEENAAEQQRTAEAKMRRELAEQEAAERRAQAAAVARSLRSP